jgi:membrane protease YdiL (CAAX protease family)
MEDKLDRAPSDQASLEAPGVPASVPESIQSPHSAPAAEAIFFGPNGLRSGWRLLLFLVIALVIALAVGKALRPIVTYLRVQIWLFAIGEAELLFAVLGSAFIMSRIERRPFGAYGLPGGGAFGKLFLVGSVWGLVWLTVLLIIMRGMGAFYFGGFAIHGIRIAKFAAFYALLFLIVGLFEEFSFRGYTQFTLTQGIGFWPAAVMLSLGFGAVHLNNQGEAAIGALAAATIGLFFCLTLLRTGSLWFAVGFHAAWDWGETYLYSVPDSGTIMPGHLLQSSFHGPAWLTGGSVGPEGSLLVFLLIGAIWAAFHWMYPEAKYKA